MHWAVQMLLILWPFFLIVGVFLCLHLITMCTGNSAPGWQLRCTECDRTRDAGEAGVTRIGAASIGKVTFGYCSECQGFRWIVIERKPNFEHASE